MPSKADARTEVRSRYQQQRKVSLLWLTGSRQHPETILNIFRKVKKKKKKNRITNNDVYIVSVCIETMEGGYKMICAVKDPTLGYHIQSTLVISNSKGLY